MLRLLVWFTFCFHASRADDYALQTGPDSRGSTYGGGFVYNPNTNLIYVTGASYGSFFQSDFSVLTNSSSPTSACFFAMVKGPSDDPKVLPQWLFASTFETSQTVTANEECNSLSLLGDSRIFIAGSSEESGILSSLRSPGGRRVLQYGMVLDVRLDYAQDSNNQTVGAVATLDGGRLINKNNVQYPIAVVASNTNNPTVSLVSLFTEIKVDNVDFTQAYPNAGSPNSPQPDLTTGGVFQYGSKYRLSTAQFSAIALPNPTQESSTGRGLEETLSEDWYEPAGVSTGDPIYASGSLLVNGADRLLVAGYTRASSGLNFAPGATTAGDMNGFVATRFSNNGSYVDGVDTVLVQSSDGGDDYLEGICQCEGAPSNSFYAVGYTNGTFQNAILKPTRSLITTAFLVKMDAITLQTIWVQQLAAPNLAAEVRGIACTVSSDNEVVYVAGNIKGNASFDGQTAWGGDDVFVAQYQTQNGAVNYIRQMGSPANDKLARGGIVTDANGNALILANTEGDWFRTRSAEESANHPPYSDLVILSVSKSTGSFRYPGPLPTMPPAYAPGVNSAAPASSSPRRMGLISVLVIIIVAVGIFALVRMGRQPQELVETDRTKVLSYLRDFDVEDIDLRHSATGGWHCTYASNPAEKEHYRYFGIGGDEDDDEEDERGRSGRSGLIRDNGGGGGGYVDPLHAPLAPLALAPIDPLLGRSPAIGRKTPLTRSNISTSSMSQGRSTSPPSLGMTQISLLSEDTETTSSTKRSRQRGSNYHGLLEAYNDTSLQPLGGDSVVSSPPPSRGKAVTRIRNIEEERWGKEII